MKQACEQPDEQGDARVDDHGACNDENGEMEPMRREEPLVEESEASR